MSDSVFRQAVAPVEPEKLPVPSTPATTTSSTVEVPYIDYVREHGQPFTVDYFKLGNTWMERDGGFTKEINSIEAYIRNKIEEGEIPNSITAVRNRLKEVEKVANVSKEERTVLKIGAVAAYLRFLNETDDIKHSIKRYGSY